jgi:hypothetical protein
MGEYVRCLPIRQESAPRASASPSCGSSSQNRDPTRSQTSILATQNIAQEPVVVVRGRPFGRDSTRGHTLRSCGVTAFAERCQVVVSRGHIASDRMRVRSDATSRPCNSQRRSVVTDTPSSFAASPIVNNSTIWIDMVKYSQIFCQLFKPLLEVILIFQEAQLIPGKTLELR